MPPASRALGCIVISVDYRLAPEAPYPAALDVAYAALQWLLGEADALGIDRGRIALTGQSAGAGLATALALRVRDRGELPICLLLHESPMRDDRTAAGLLPGGKGGELVWTRDHNRFAWSASLGCPVGSEGVPAHAAPGRASDLAGMPPTFLGVGALDLFAREDIEFARRLIEVGVQTELHVLPGACHGFKRAGESRVAQRFCRDATCALAHAFNSTVP